jgi:hypothetical protein
MFTCPNCGAEWIAEAVTCIMCGSGPVLPPPAAPPPSPPPAIESPVTDFVLQMDSIASGVLQRVCPACGKHYPADYRDSFCSCGVELAGVAPMPLTTTLPSAVAEAEPPPVTESMQPPPPLVAAEPMPVPRPPAGTRCLVLYSPDKRPVHYFPLTKDVTLIGRIDVVQGSFPDIDLDTCVEPAVARKVSRRHALILTRGPTTAMCFGPWAATPARRWRWTWCRLCPTTR